MAQKRKAGKTPRRQKKNTVKSQQNLPAARRASRKQRAALLQAKSIFPSGKGGGSYRKTEAALPCKIVKLGATFGFAAPLDGTADIFIPGRLMQGAMPGDKVLVAPFLHPHVPDSREGEVVKITQEHNQLVGAVLQRGTGLVFVPDIAPGYAMPVRFGKKTLSFSAGDKVAAEIIHRGTRHSEHQVRVVQRFGTALSAKNCAEANVYAAGIPTEFSPAVLHAADEIAGDIAPQLLAGREDLRGEVIFTIDPATAKDLDDAVSAAKTATGYTLGVHIADVSHYVRAGTALDIAAFQRGTSVYYGDQVIPMLPEALSNGACSMTAGEDKLAFSCLMQLDKDAKLVDFRFAKTVVHSRVQGAYHEVNELFASTADAALQKKYAAAADSINILHEIYQKLHKLRIQRGNIDIESSEPYIVLDEKGRCVGIEKRERGNAEKLIEECMLMANTAAAMLAKKQKFPFLYRVHEAPPSTKLEQLKTALDAVRVPYRFKEEAPTQTELAALLDETRDTPLAYFVHHTVLRSMAKAKYDTLPLGHYGLALADYAHFTSPIRRYPDLAIHRILTDYVNGLAPKDLREKYAAFAENAALQSSESELTAQKLERDCDDCYKAEYMQQYIGEEMEGVISSVTAFGIYVQLGNTVEGMLPLAALPGEGLKVVKDVAVTNPATGQSYRIGDSVRVLVASVNIAQGHVDFVLP